MRFVLIKTVFILIFFAVSEECIYSAGKCEHHLMGCVSKLLGFVHQLHRGVLSSGQSLSTLPQSHVHPVDNVTDGSFCSSLPSWTFFYKYRDREETDLSQAQI